MLPLHAHDKEYRPGWRLKERMSGWIRYVLSSIWNVWDVPSENYVSAILFTRFIRRFWRNVIAFLYIYINCFCIKMLLNKPDLAMAYMISVLTNLTGVRGKKLKSL